MSNDTSTSIAELKQRIEKRLRLNVERAVLGDENGRIDEPGRPGYVRVRRQTSEGLGKYEVVRERGVFVRTPGAAVKVGLDSDGELAVIEGDFAGQLAQGANPLLNNTANTDIYQWVGQSQITTLYSHALTTATTLSTSVAVRAWIYVRNNTLQRFPGAQVSLSSYIPASGLHRIAVVFVTVDNSTEVVSSTTKNTLDPLGLTDVQECLDARSPGSYPVWAWKLADAQTSITENDKYLDVRGIINVDAVDGVDTFPTALRGPVLVPSNRAITVSGHIDATDGYLKIEGRLDNTP